MYSPNGVRLKSFYNEMGGFGTSVQKSRNAGAKQCPGDVSFVSGDIHFWEHVPIAL